MSDSIFYDENKPKHGLKAKLASANPFVVGFLSFGTIAAVAGAIWTFAPSGETDESLLPIIQASTEQIRFEPNGSQDIDIAGSDSRIYETFGNGANQPRIENLLSVKDIEEQAIMPSREELFAGLKPEIQVRAPEFENKTANITESPFEASNKDSGASNETETPRQQANVFPNKIAVIKRDPPQNTTDTAANEPVQAKPIQKPAVPKSTQSQSDDTKIVPGLFASDAPNPPSEAELEAITSTEPAAGAMSATAVKKVAPKPATTQSYSSDGNYYVQLVSIQDNSKIDKAWNDLTKKHGALKSVNYRTQSATISGRGQFYRIQAGPFSKSSANDLCNTVKSEGGSCLVTSK